MTDDAERPRPSGNAQDAGSADPGRPSSRDGGGEPEAETARDAGGDRTAGGVPLHAGDRVAAVLRAHGVETVFTLCGGHISPILHGCKRAGIAVADTRHEAAAVFAADATARLTGRPGVAAVTAGPGVTNAVTPIANARLAQSPVLVLGGAPATVLAGRGALQDVDHLAVVRPHVKLAVRVPRISLLAPTLREALAVARTGAPGPVFVELPVDLLYPEAVVRSWYAKQASGGGIAGRGLRFLLSAHLRRMFTGAGRPYAADPITVSPMDPDRAQVRRAAAYLAKARRPVVVAGSSLVDDPDQVEPVRTALSALGAPVYLSGMARGLFGRSHPLWVRHHRRTALREADVVLLLGVPCDFRMDYGRTIPRSTTVIAVHRGRRDLFLNRRPTVPMQADPARALTSIVDELPKVAPRYAPFVAAVRERDEAREAEIAALADAPAEGGLHPVAVLKAVDERLTERSTIVADGGDFVGTAAYVLRPRGPLRWLDPGVFGTLGVGGGFALGAKLLRPDDDVWAIYGDGSVGYSLAEFETYARLGAPVVAVVGNDGSWAQIAREQVEVLEDPVGTVLSRSDYHLVAEALGGRGFRVTRREELVPALDAAVAAARDGSAALVNVHVGRTDFRKGSISI